VQVRAGRSARVTRARDHLSLRDLVVDVDQHAVGLDAALSGPRGPAA
jgi:hypothetical protein